MSGYSVRAFVALAVFALSLSASAVAADPRFTARADALMAIAQSCAGGQASGPMGCGGPMGTESRYSSSSPSYPAFSAPAVQGQ